MYGFVPGCKLLEGIFIDFVMKISELTMIIIVVRRKRVVKYEMILWQNNNSFPKRFEIIYYNFKFL